MPATPGRPGTADLPPGQVLIADLPTVGPEPPPRIGPAEWELSLITEDGGVRRWDWAAIRALPSEQVTVDLHCVHGWSVVDTRWTGVPVATLFDGVRTTADHAVVDSYGGYTTNLPLEDLLEMPTWLVHAFDGQDLTPEQGGPARLLVPHLYLWKSVRWVRGITLSHRDQPGWYERHGYHNYGDPWREQRFSGD
ncbi:molybdopterin-dependent oxidoreductase [Actinophytocola sp.]|jgi:DMSO/TMAO reductase YedYZ molybdopterin-dependent catalytic subunit|uniref:molybdopterin-dependent oxidoreductase n=1 Tax=Actinophytocola sp. TaxID=1872138 RepID=UPI002ED97806